MDKNEQNRKKTEEEIRRKIETLPIKNFHWMLLLLLGVGWALDAMSAGLVSFGLPSLEGELALKEELGILGFLLSAWNIGMFFGAFILGNLADKVGRKSPILLSILLYSLPTGLTAFSNSWQVIFVLRLLSGMGSAGYMATASTHLSEYLPKGKRGRWVAFLESAWAFGWLLASYFGLVLIGNFQYSWRSIMKVGFLPFLLLLPLGLFLPESVRFLLRSGKQKEAQKILDQLGISESTPIAKSRNEASIKYLLKGKYKKRTIMLWVHWFSIVLVYWGIFLWLPKVLADEKGLGTRSLLFAFTITAAQIPGYWSGAWLIEKVGRKYLLCAYMAIAGVASFFFAISEAQWQVLVSGALISFFNLGAWGATYAYTPELYPTSIRGTGSGAANSVGRIGGIVGPLLAGLLAGIFGSFYWVFIVFTAFHFVSAIVIGLFGEETKGKPLEA